MSMRNILLLADDMSSNRVFLRRLFENDYDILEAENGDQTLQLVAENQDNIAAVLLDLIMPVKDGYQVLAEMGEKGYLSEIPVIVVTSDSSQKSEARALELGALDLVAKPYDPYIVRRRVQNLVELKRTRRMLSEQVGEMTEAMSMTNDTIVNTLATITEFRSLESGQHILRIRKFVQILLEEVAGSFPEYELDDKKISIISSAAVLHDIGKISIPDSILNKPGKLTREEFEIMKTHTTAGCEILEGMTNVVDREYMRYAYNICRYHHERWDGRGYPDGLKGENTPICAQVVGIADVYDALTTRRVYKGAVGYEESANMILNGECGVFNPLLLECFKRVLDDFAACAKSYADGEVSAAEDILAPLPLPKMVAAGINTQQMATIKYHTLLNYVGGVVIEVDIDTGAYHLVYDADKMFGAWHRDGNFDSLVQNLIEKSVHPRDRSYTWRCFSYLKNGFFEEGLRKYIQKFRVRSHEAAEYVWAECTFLRVDTGIPSQHKAIVTWKQGTDSFRQLARKTRLDEWGANTLREMIGLVLRTRNDKWQTIVDGEKPLASLLGYTEDEFHQSFHDRLLSVILPEDRETLLTYVDRQLNHGTTVEVEYRLLGKNGRITWVKDRASVVLNDDGIEYIYHAIIDNTAVQEAMDQLRSARERHQILLNQLEEITFEWDIMKDRIVFSPNFKRQFGYEPVSTGFAQYVLGGTAYIHPEDLELVQEQIRAVRSQQNYPHFLGADFRIRKEDGSYLWRRMRASTQQMENGKIECVVGALIDIEEHKQDRGGSQDRTEQDALTKLYNKQAATEKIEEALKERSCGGRPALLLIDLDHFHDANHRFGRMAGDKMLLQCAALLKKVFRKEDILARIGGDEFLVLMKHVPVHSMLQSRCKQLIELVAQEAVKQLPGSTVSCSIGIALAPEDGDTFDVLFKRSAQALRNAKNRGGGCHVFYHQGDPVQDNPDVAGSRIESDEIPGLADQSLVQYAIDQLYQSGDMEKTIQAVMELIGRQMNVSRVYIFENSPDNRACSNIYEWCNDEIEPQREKMQDVSYETDIPGWLSHYNSQGVFLCEDVSELPDDHRAILAPQGIRSMVMCAIMEDGMIRGFVGVDECLMERTWTRDQVEMLSTFAKLTAVLLLKKQVPGITRKQE